MNDAIFELPELESISMVQVIICLEVVELFVESEIYSLEARDGIFQLTM
jgi:hypothetical protein